VVALVVVPDLAVERVQVLVVEVALVAMGGSEVEVGLELVAAVVSVAVVE
jgi:hypothetical protein